MVKSRSQIQLIFNRANLDRHNISNIPKSLQEMIYYMDYKIRKQLKSFTLLSICGADRNNFIVERSFQRAFSSMNLQQKTNYYGNHVSYAVEVQKNSEKQLINFDQQFREKKGQEKLCFDIKIFRGYGNWEFNSIELQQFKVISKNNNSFKLDLRNYLLRSSKKKDKICYVLQSIKYDTLETIRFCFINQFDEETYLQAIKNRINMGLKENIRAQMLDMEQKKKINQLKISKQFKDKNLLAQEKKQCRDSRFKNQTNFLNLPNNFPEQPYLMPLQSNIKQNYSKMRESRSICQQIVKSKDDQYLDQQLSQLVCKQNEQIEQRNNFVNYNQNCTNRDYQNIFRIFLPNYYLSDLPLLLHYRSVDHCEETNVFIYESTNDSFTYKMHFSVNLSLQVSCKAISNMHLYKFWHSQIEQAQVKLKISSQNSCLMYQHVKPFSEWYRERDFLTLMHLFKEGNSCYIVGKSIENTNYIPLQSMIRGNIDHMIWKITPQQGDKCKIIMEVKIDHCGLLNKSHQKELTLRYLQGFKGMSKYFQEPDNCKKMVNNLGMNWINFNDKQTFRTIDFENGSQISEQDEEQIFYSIDNLSDEDQPFEEENKQNLSMPQQLSMKKKKRIQKHQEELSQHEVEEKAANQDEKLKTLIMVGDIEEIILNQEGNTILPRKYLKRKFPVKPFDTEISRVDLQHESLVLTDVWSLEKAGGLKMINKQKIKAQDNVLGYIMKTLKKNLFSGKGILNISLPVDVFNKQSNLQRVAKCMSYGPQCLQKVANLDPLSRFKQVLAFGLSNSILYFDVEKPFNPILGQTYQGYIRGCPVYAEQISHHPPITSIYFVGRGYKVTASLQSKVNIHLNSGDGINEGFFHVIFDNDGQQILFQTPPGELSGLAVGDRKFTLQGKAYYIDKINQLYCEMKFFDDSGYFSKSKRTFIDEISGQIVKVKQSFVNKFLTAPNDKKPTPDKSQIVEKYSELSGRWPKSLQVDKNTIYDVQDPLPDKMVDQLYPLNSNSNYRQDIYFKKLNDNGKSQLNKQKLEVIQREDRKLREKYTGKKKGH